jgi:hypothetical protein
MLAKYGPTTWLDVHPVLLDSLQMGDAEAVVVALRRHGFLFTRKAPALAPALLADAERRLHGRPVVGEEQTLPTAGAPQLSAELAYQHGTMGVLAPAGAWAGSSEAEARDAERAGWLGNRFFSMGGEAWTAFVLTVICRRGSRGLVMEIVRRGRRDLLTGACEMACWLYICRCWQWVVHQSLTRTECLLVAWWVVAIAIAKLGEALNRRRAQIAAKQAIL